MRPIFFFFLFFFSLCIQAQSWKQKIEPTIAPRFEKGETVDCIVTLLEQADVSAASVLRTKNEKGQYVFKTLRATAERTQARLITLLKQEKNTEYQAFWIVNMLRLKADNDLIEKIASLEEVASITPNSHLRMLEPIRDETVLGNFRSIEWGVSKIEADKVWAGTAPLTQGYTGAGVVVGGQDTGYDYTHPALNAKYRGTATGSHDYNWHDAILSVSTVSFASTTNTCGFNLLSPCDDQGHGTHTMGTMVGKDGVNEIGVAPDAKWIGVRNMSTGDGTPSTYIDAFQWFLAPTKIDHTSPDPTKAPHVINNSWGCPTVEGCNPSNYATMETAVNNLRAAGVVVVVSAGNEGSACSSVQNPAGIFAGSFSVGATDLNDVIGSFSSRGPVTVDGSNRMKPDISAPGVNVRSCTPNNTYSSFSGTSMSGPHVAGAVALMISANPALAGQVVQIESILKNTANHLLTTQNCGGTANVTPNNVFGHGRINVFAAVQNALLPIELIGFYGKQENKAIDLHWATANEINNSHFEIERSADLEQWERVVTVGGNGTTNLPHDYTSEDRQPYKGINYYRLKQVDFDGTSKIHEIIAVMFKGYTPIHLHLFPVPVQNELRFAIENIEDGIYSLEIIDLQGKQVSQQFIEANNAHIATAVSTNTYSTGIYFAQLRSEKGQIVAQERFIKADD
jgi:serine protease AprX